MNGYGKQEIGSSIRFPHPRVKRGYALWIESGIWYTAPKVDRKKFGHHAYYGKEFDRGVRDCPCGCYMLSSSSGGPVDPFGPCPLNPKTNNL